MSDSSSYAGQSLIPCLAAQNIAGESGLVGYGRRTQSFPGWRRTRPSGKPKENAAIYFGGVENLRKSCRAPVNKPQPCPKRKNYRRSLPKLPILRLLIATFPSGPSLATAPGCVTAL